MSDKSLVSLLRLIWRISQPICSGQIREMRKVFSKIKIPDKSTVGIGAAERCFLDRWSNLASFVSNINRNRKEGGKGKERE